MDDLHSLAGAVPFVVLRNERNHTVLDEHPSLSLAIPAILVLDADQLGCSCRCPGRQMHQHHQLFLELPHLPEICLHGAGLPLDMAVVAALG